MIKAMSFLFPLSRTLASIPLSRRWCSYFSAHSSRCFLMSLRPPATRAACALLLH